MINVFREYYTQFLKDKKGKVIKMDDLEIDFTFAGMDNWKTIVTHGLAAAGAVKLHFGIEVRSDTIPLVKEQVGQIKLFNEVKAKGAEINLNKEKYSGIETEEDFQKAAKERLDEFKKEVEEAQKVEDIRVIKDTIILLPFDVEPSSYQDILTCISKNDKFVHNEDLYIEIL